MNSAEKWAETNRPVIERLRADKGKYKGFERMLILHTKGARTGREHIVPVMCLIEGDRYVVFASIGDALKNPAWYHNLLAHPEITIEVGGETREVCAIVVTGPERDALYARQAAAHSYFAGFQKKTKRIIPVVALEPR